jgi:hypothetical protein
VRQLLLYDVNQRLWHGNVEAALEYLKRMSFDRDLDHQSSSQQLLRETQQVQGMPERAHFLLQTRAQILKGDIEAAFRDWYLSFRQAAACPSGL